MGDCVRIQVKTNHGWKDIEKTVRHKIEWNIYRITAKHGIVDVTEDQNLLGKNIEIIKPHCLVKGEKFLHNHIKFGEPKKHLIKFFKFVL